MSRIAESSRKKLVMELPQSLINKGLDFCSLLDCRSVFLKFLETSTWLSFLFSCILKILVKEKFYQKGDVFGQCLSKFEILWIFKQSVGFFYIFLAFKWVLILSTCIWFFKAFISASFDIKFCPWLPGGKKICQISLRQFEKVLALVISAVAVSSNSKCRKKVFFSVFFQIKFF